MSRSYMAFPYCLFLPRFIIVRQIPDRSIARLYPISDNYISNDDGTRSPMSLAEMCTRTLCRSLPDLNGSLPSGLPQEIVDDVVSSLVKHSALNATTLRVLQKCELTSLSLAGCRGVNDDFIQGLVDTDHAMDLDYAMAMDTLKSGDNSIAEESSSFVSARSSSFKELGSDRAAPDGQQQKEFSKSDDFSMEEQDDYYSITSGHHEDELAMPASNLSNLTELDLRGSHRITDNGLLQLSDLPSLHLAQLDNCYSIQGRGLLAFSNSYCLRALSLVNCRRLQDEGLINISHLLSLETLSLVGCRCITDRSLTAIAGLKRMKKLDLSQCDLITDSGLEQLFDMPFIEELSLGWCRSISNRGVRTIAHQHGRSQNLRCLCLSRVPFTDDGARELVTLKALEELDVNGCSSIGSTVLGHVLEQLTCLRSLDVSYCPGILLSSWQGKIKTLKSLDLCYSGVRDSQLGRLTSLECLTELNLAACPIGDWALAHLADNEVAPNLTHLDIGDTDVTDLAMSHVAKFKKLKRLSLFYCNVSNSSLRNLSQLSDLEALNLDSRDIGDNGVWHLRGLQKLKSLDIFSGRVTDRGCSSIAQIKSLESLELCGGGIDDVGVTILATLENLTSLNLSQNERITNRGAAALAALSKLKALNLSNTRVNAGALVHLSDLMELKSIALYGCRGLDEVNDGLADLQGGLPNLRCVRLNHGPDNDDDGVIPENDDFDSDDDDENDDESDSEMEDVSSQGDDDEDFELEHDEVGTHDEDGDHD
mmetsp:Transcript_58105/g.142033  ORF Transcript_58105/g.142033 Transcript_58105/m.142033 type:complete len:763 (-) Transcript_58105:98-2386(-)